MLSAQALFALLAFYSSRVFVVYKHCTIAHCRCYLENTKSSYGDTSLYDVWSVDREGEAQRFATHDKISNRKLLWHGTNGETYVCKRWNVL